MCSTFTPDCRYDKSISKIIGNNYCANTMCSGMPFMHRFFNLLKEVLINALNGSAPVKSAKFHPNNDKIRFP